MHTRHIMRPLALAFLTTIGVNPANQTAVCGEDMLGDPPIGAQVTLSIDSGSGGVPIARAPVTLIK